MLSYIIYFQKASFVTATCVLPLSKKQMSFKKQLGIIKKKKNLNNTILARSCHQLRASVCKTSPTFNSYDTVAFNPVTDLKPITWVSWVTIKKQSCGEWNELILTRKSSGRPSVPKATRTCKNTPKSCKDPRDAQPRARPSPAVPRVAPLSLQRGARKGKQTLREPSESAGGRQE